MVKDINVSILIMFFFPTCANEAFQSNRLRRRGGYIHGEVRGA